MRNYLLIAALLLGAFLFAGWTFQKPVQWEYSRVVFRDKPDEVSKKINELGADGWELIQYYPSSDSAFLGMYLFKRAK